MSRNKKSGPSRPTRKGKRAENVTRVKKNSGETGTQKSKGQNGFDVPLSSLSEKIFGQGVAGDVCAASSKGEPSRGEGESGCEPLKASKKTPQPHSQRFILEKKIGSGGLCEVYEATDLLLLSFGCADPVVAVKKLLPEYQVSRAGRQLLAKEFCFGRQINSSHVVRYHDLMEENGELLLSMELLTGERLDDLIARYPQGVRNIDGVFWAFGPLPAFIRGRHYRATPTGMSWNRFGWHLFSALAVLHSRGIAHGDIKPSNIFYEAKDRLVLFDMNTAESIAIENGPSPKACLQAELRIPSYSLLYAAPERLAGECPSASGDIYSACCTLAELFLGEHPFGRRSALEHGKEEFPLELLALPHRYRKILQQGLRKEPKLRPDALSLVRAFKR